MSGEDLHGTGLRSCLAIDNNNSIVNFDSDSGSNSDNECNNKIIFNKSKKNLEILDNLNSKSSLNSNPNSNLYTNSNLKLNSNYSDTKNHSSIKKSKKNSATKARQVVNFRKKTRDESVMVLQALKAASTRMNIFQNIYKILMVNFFFEFFFHVIFGFFL